ncbi:uncharacterized [Tachysurus ichikawai]
MSRIASGLNDPAEYCTAGRKILGGASFQSRMLRSALSVQNVTPPFDLASCRILVASYSKRVPFCVLVVVLLAASVLTVGCCM